MTLRDNAVELVETLQAIVQCLYAYDRDYTKGLAKILHPQVEALSDAVCIRRSRKDAQDVLADLAPTMHQVNGAATKGEMDIFPDNALLDKYWELETIFRESRYSTESL